MVVLVGIELCEGRGRVLADPLEECVGRGLVLVWRLTPGGWWGVSTGEGQGVELAHPRLNLQLSGGGGRSSSMAAALIGGSGVGGWSGGWVDSRGAGGGGFSVLAGCWTWWKRRKASTQRVSNG